MEFINKINGAIFFVDILGMGALTQNQIKLKNEDFKPWLDEYSVDYNNQHLSASILTTFRDVLNNLNNKFPNVTIAQLSDCAFIWSESITDIVLASNNFMSEAISKGILCRGGMSYGEIIETTQNSNSNLGRFIVGEAVSNAVKLEGMAKGARILISENFPLKFWEENSYFRNKLEPMFKPFINPLDFNTYDEFKWYLVPNLDIEVEDLTKLSEISRVKLTKNRLKFAAKIRIAPKFLWNSKSPHGLIQLNATINFMSENKLLNIDHDFEWYSVVSKRSTKILADVETLIDSNNNFTRIY